GWPRPPDTRGRCAIAQVRSPGGLALPRTRVHWFGGEAVSPGEHWRFALSLRRPAGMSTPGGFDYEAWLYAQGVGALGSIRRGERLEEPAGTSPVARLRYSIRDQLAT